MQWTPPPNKRTPAWRKRRNRRSAPFIIEASGPTLLRLCVVGAAHLSRPDRHSLSAGQAFPLPIRTFSPEKGEAKLWLQLQHHGLESLPREGVRGLNGERHC